MIVVRGSEIEAKDWGEMVGAGPIGIKIKWLIHNEVGDERYGHRFAVREFTVVPGEAKPMPRHNHKYVEAAYVISGRGVFTTETKEYEVGPGDIVYTYPDELHGGNLVNDATEPLKILCCIECISGGENCTPEGKGVTVNNPCD